MSSSKDSWQCLQKRPSWSVPKTYHTFLTLHKYPQDRARNTETAMLKPIVFKKRISQFFHRWTTTTDMNKVHHYCSKLKSSNSADTQKCCISACTSIFQWCFVHQPKKLGGPSLLKILWYQLYEMRNSGLLVQNSLLISLICLRVLGIRSINFLGTGYMLCPCFACKSFCECVSSFMSLWSFDHWAHSP